jgi:molybdopterin-biosynthesis enzyme MoeA-like protein
VGADIIPNPYNRIPGFEIRQHFFFPGFPVMAWPMMAWVLDERFSHLHHQQVLEERSFLVYELAESTATPLMESLEREFAGIKVFSLPSVGEDGSRRHIELGVKGPTASLEAAFHKLRAGAAALGGEVGAEQPARGAARA